MGRFRGGGTGSRSVNGEIRMKIVLVSASFEKDCWNECGD